MNLELGLQLFTVRNYLRDDLEAGLKRFGEMGFKNVEFASYDPEALLGEKKEIQKLSASEMNAMMKRLGMKLISFSVPAPNDVQKLLATDFNWEGAAQYAAETGCVGLSIAMMFFRNQSEVMAFARYCNDVAAICRNYGVKFIYHNHFQEFQKFDGKYALDIFLENTDPEWVKVELDTFWVRRGGQDPVEYMEKIGNRCILIHQKDLNKACANINLVEDTSEMIGQESFDRAKPDDFIEVGQGILDVSGIIKKARDIGSAAYLIIEQDYSRLDPVASAQLSYDYIKKFF